MTATVTPTGLFEAHLLVADLERSVRFYRDVVGLPLALRLPERGAAFFWVGARGRSMLGLWSGGSAPMGMRLHVALRASRDDVIGGCDWLRRRGITPLSFFGVETDEPSVIGWMPAVAIYFEDPDGHMIEYLAMLDDTPNPEAGIVSWSQWSARAPRPAPRVQRHIGDRAPLRRLFEEAEDSAAALDAYIDDGDVFVALRDGEVAGHLQLVGGGDPLEIKNMAVEERHRGQGVGTALIRTAIDETRRRRASTLQVATASADVGNLRFYQRCGFRVSAIDRDAFTPATGYAAGTLIDGIELRDRVWLDFDLARSDQQTPR